MAAIEIKVAQVFYAPTKRRRYFSAESAATAEATALMRRKYPNERPDYDDGRMTYPGYCFEADPDLQPVYNRLRRAILRKIRSKMTTGEHE